MVVSSEPEASDRPSGDQATLRIALECPVRVCRVCPVFVSQNRMVLSAAPEASICPLGDQATLRTKSEWPISVRIS